MKIARKLTATFYYFRVGYANYLALLIGVINILTTSYFLAIKRIPEILSIFPTFEIYLIFVIGIGIPIITLGGWLHYKRIGTYSAEASLSAEADPYNYKLTPGYQIEVYGPAYLAMLQINIKRTKGEKLTEEEIKNIKNLEDKISKLIEGGYASNTPKGAFR